ncbi:murein L,D-transpeptidase [Streptosporangiaceae bacterium NEAU-GS5]|nr:murein L,D-transpeptidase [Streptosporangiaceae bacterium NEAU-GS5]
MGVRRQLAIAALLTVGFTTAGTAAQGASASTRTGASTQVSASVHTSVGAAASVRSAASVRAAAFHAPHKTLKPGMRGAAVKELQTRLRALGYVPGKIDGRYGGSTQAAVWAFQKVQGIRPTSTVAAKTWNALENPKAPKVLVPGGAATRVEINLTRQIMVYYVSGSVKLISHISSGSGIPYVEYAVWNGKRQRFSGGAVTPTGDFKTSWRVSGWHRSYLGQLYNPIFFNGGIALHGALSVPLYPASHGCVRLPMAVAGILPGMLGTGVPVHVRGHFKR